MAGELCTSSQQVHQALDNEADEQNPGGDVPTVESQFYATRNQLINLSKRKSKYVQYFGRKKLYGIVHSTPYKCWIRDEAMTKICWSGKAANDFIACFPGYSVALHPRMRPMQKRFAFASFPLQLCLPACVDF